MVICFLINRALVLKAQINIKIAKVILTFKIMIVVFLGIENIHVVRDSMNRLMDALTLAQNNALPISQTDKYNRF